VETIRFDQQDQQGKAAFVNATISPQSQRGQETQGRGELRNKTRGQGEDTYRRRENNKGHKQKCHQNSMKQHRHTSEKHKRAPPQNNQQHRYCWGVETG
jgi:nucleosome binding factor SPN SPT16 subunit